MRLRTAIPFAVFALVLCVHIAWLTYGRSAGPWASFTPDEGSAAGNSYLAGGRVWLGLSYAAAAAFAAFCLTRLYEYRKSGLAGAAGGLGLLGFLYIGGCFLIGCCGSPMLGVYLALLGPRFLGLAGPLVLAITLSSVLMGYIYITRRTGSGCGCEEGSCGTGSASDEHECLVDQDADEERPDAPGTGQAPASVEAVVEMLRRAEASEKCWACACLRNALDSIEKAFSGSAAPQRVAEAINACRRRLLEPRYDCRGCEVCFPAVALNALSELIGPESLANISCTSERAEEREGWPPLAGDYSVLSYRAPVAVCTLTDEALRVELARGAGAAVSTLGSLQTENLGIERVIANVLANPNIRFLILCGADSRGRVGHLPGQSFVSLARSGLDGSGRINGAEGKRPWIRNVSREAVEHFRATVEVVDLIGSTDHSGIHRAALACSERNPGPAEPFEPARAIRPIKGRVPERMKADPAGYFVIFVDHQHQQLSIEHYRASGVLDCIIEGKKGAELYHRAIELGLVSRLDHAAYLGRELARAEQALESAQNYVQDRAAEADPTSRGDPCCC